MNSLYLSEAFVIKDHDVKEIITEVNGRERRVLQLEGLFGSAEKKNRNQRIYPLPILEREISKVKKEKILSEGGLIGELEHPVMKADDSSGLSRAKKIAYERACIAIKDLRFAGNDIIGRCEILEDANDCGRSVASIVRSGIRPGISSRAVGSKPSINEEGALVVADDLELITFDIVSDPSTYGARLNAMINEEVEKIQYEAKSAHKRTLWHVVESYLK